MLVPSRPLAGLACLVALSCGHDAAEPPPRPPSATLAAGELRITADVASQLLTLSRGGEALLRFSLDSLQLGMVDALDDGFHYDPVQIYVPDSRGLPDALSWRKASAFEVRSASSARLELALRFEGGLLGTLVIEAERDDSLRALLRPDRPEAPPGSPAIAFLRLSPRASSTEGFYGLGETFDTVEHRGKVRPMQLGIDTSLESASNEVHVPVPLVIGTRGWGLFVESRRPGAFAIATGGPSDDRIDAAFATTTDSSSGLTFHLFGARRALDITRLYYEVTGFPRLPAPWATGPWIWRNESDDQAQVERDADTIRGLDLATSGYWIDRPYATGVETFDFEARRFPDPRAMLARLHDLGLSTALWHAPYLDTKDPATQAAYASAVASGYYPPVSGVPLNKWGPLIDLTNPAALSWWKGQLRAYRELGVDGYKLDYGEDVVPGVGRIRTPWRFADGSDERTMHAGYTLAYHAAYAATLDTASQFLLCRHGTWGDQAHGCVIWPGDLDATFARHREPAADAGGKSYVSVGGLPASVVAGVSLGVSGFPFYGADTGGYRHSPPDKELFVRWFEQTALSSVMQVGTASSTVPWETEKNPGFDAELLSLYRDYARLHLRLWPYEWTYAERMRMDGRPIQRPPGLQYPELGEHPSDAYLFGDDLYVAPVLSRNTRSRRVRLPPGDWLDFWTHARRSGELQADAPLGTLPLYLRVGGIVPMLRPTIDTLSATTRPALVDSYATDPGVLTVLVAVVDPGGAGSFTVFDGTKIDQGADASSVTVSLGEGKIFRRGTRLELLGMERTTGVSIDGASAPMFGAPGALDSIEGDGWAVTGEGVVHVRVSAGSHTVKIARGAR